MPNAPNPLTLNNLDSLNAAGPNVYLTSVDDITTKPAWLKGVKPDASGKTNGAISTAIIVNDHGSGTVDAFYMYFYAFNYGPPVLGQDVDDHVGDWEHTMVRFLNGKPQAVWFSQVIIAFYQLQRYMSTKICTSMRMEKPSAITPSRNEG